MKKYIILGLWCAVSSAQNNYPKDLFASPLGIPLRSSGTFGELRPDHFHSGIDLKTQGREGLPVYAIGEGYVSRIKISHWGFGKVIYINHPEGYTSVYAHLQKFSPEIDAYVRKQQYEKKSYEIELFPEKNKLALNKQQLIGYTGNTGSSGGPHLHFEIRARDTQRPINPMFFGIDIKDTKPPSVNGLFVYALSDSTQVNQSNTKLQLHLHREKDNIYLADTLYAEGIIGFGIDVHDTHDLTQNKNGIYALEMAVNDTLVFHYDFESFSFNETKYINTLIDYDHYATARQRIQQCFVFPYNKLSIYNKKINNGRINIRDGESYIVVIKAEDFKNNERIVKIPIIGKKQALLYKKEVYTSAAYLKATQINHYDLGTVKVDFPAHTFYHDFYADFKDHGDGTYRIHHKGVPTHKYFSIHFDVTHYSIEERKKLFIARWDDDKDTLYVNTKKKGGLFTARTKKLGTYLLARDDEPPKINPKNFKDGQWISSHSHLLLEVKDTISGIKDYKATINGSWVLMEYEPKNDSLTYHFSDDGNKEGSRYELEVQVTDQVGNRSIFTSTLYRKP